MSLKDRAVGWGWSAGWTLLRLLPEKTAYGLFDRIADRVWKKRGGGVLQLEANLKRVLGKDVAPEILADTSHRAMRSAMRYYCEAFRLPTWSRDRVIDSIDISDEDAVYLKSVLDSGRGAMMALGHSGNYDHAGAWLLTSIKSFTTVAEHLKPQSVYDAFYGYRRSLGMEVLPHDGGAKVIGTLAQRLRAGGAVCLVADRDLSASGVQVDFFGEAARMAAGPAVLAERTGAALLPVHLWYSGPGRMGIRVHREIPIPAEGTRQEKVALMTQGLADAWEEGIAAHPEDWHMLQKFFLADLDPTRAPKAAGGSQAAQSVGPADPNEQEAGER
jgi:phosphatidylinositol dimannoside acyltransferase